MLTQGKCTVLVRFEDSAVSLWQEDLKALEELYAARFPRIRNLYSERTLSF